MAKSPYGFTRSKREGDDLEAINRLFAPEFRNRLDAVVPFGHLPRDVIAKVVDKFIMQLDAQLADRNVTIELTDEARNCSSSMVTTRRWARVRWGASFSKTSSRHWRTKSCSANSKAAAPFES